MRRGIHELPLVNRGDCRSPLPLTSERCGVEMEWDQIGVGVFFLLISSLLRAWVRINLRLPVYSRPAAFQGTRFPLFLSMLLNAFWVLGVLILFVAGFWIGIVGVLLYVAALVPALAWGLGRILKYDLSSGNTRRAG